MIFNNTYISLFPIIKDLVNKECIQSSHNKHEKNYTLYIFDNPFRFLLVINKTTL